MLKYSKIIVCSNTQFIRKQNVEYMYYVHRQSVVQVLFCKLACNTTDQAAPEQLSILLNELLWKKKSSLDQHVKRKHSNEPIKVLHKPKPAPKQCPHCDKVLFMIIIVNYLYYRCY